MTLNVLKQIIHELSYGSKSAFSVILSYGPASFSNIWTFTQGVFQASKIRNLPSLQLLDYGHSMVTFKVSITNIYGPRPSCCATVTNRGNTEGHVMTLTA